MTPGLKPEQVFNTKNLNRLSKSLLENFGSDKRGRRRQRWSKATASSYSRADIVDEKACDDIIKYLGPSLEKHKGCSIIDVHPGACLFSQKLHDYLKPKWHLLMEPEERYVEPYVRPLLDQPGSTYCHTYLAGAHPTRYWESYMEIQKDPTLLPPRPAFATGDPKLRELDPSLLVIGNLERMYTEIARRIDLTPLMLHQLPYAALANELFQRSGLVRMLWWVPERIKHQVLPRTPMLRTSFNHGIEMGVEPTEIAGVTSLHVHQDYTSTRRRPIVYDRIVEDEVAQRMRDSGMSVPKRRELLIEDRGKDAEVSKRAHKSPLESAATTVAELQEKVDKARERFSIIANALAHNPRGRMRADGSPTTAMRGLFESIEYPQSFILVNSITERISINKTRSTVLVDLALRILNLEASYKGLEDKGNEEDALNALKAAILKLDDDLNALAKTFTATQHLALADILEETIAFYTSPRQMALDRRAFEPLKLDNDDFFPPTNNLSLIELMPKTRDLNVPDLADNKEAAKICAEMLRQLYSAKMRSVPNALDTFAVNAGQDLVPMVLAICDVRRGGRLNPQNVRVRMLTEEMMEGLVKAFFEWPFRPQTWEVTALSHSAGPAEGAAGEEGEGGGVIAEAVAEQ